MRLMESAVSGLLAWEAVQMIGDASIDPSEVRVGGTELNYYLICPAKLWLFAHGIEMERTSDRVDLGRLLHEESYSRARHRELMVDNLIRIDFDESAGVVHEVKMSKAFEEAHKYQLLYYLYYLKKRGQHGLTGIINYPKSRRTVEVELTPEAETAVEEIVRQVCAVKTSNACPTTVHRSCCRRCSYEDYCWG